MMFGVDSFNLINKFERASKIIKCVFNHFTQNFWLIHHLIVQYHLYKEFIVIFFKRNIFIELG